MATDPRILQMWDDLYGFNRSVGPGMGPYNTQPQRGPLQAGELPQMEQPTRPATPTPTPEQQARAAETARHRAAINASHGDNTFSISDDKKPGFFGGMYSGLVHDIPRLGLMLGDAYNTNWGPLGGVEGDTHEDRLWRIEQLQHDRETQGEWTQFQHVWDDESIFQNFQDFTLWARETIGRTFPAMAAGLVAYGTGAGQVGTIATATAASYPFILSEMLNRNYEETTAQGELDYNAGATIALAIPGAAVEGLSQYIVPIRLIGPTIRRLGQRALGQTVPDAVRQSILAGTFRELSIGAATGASEEAIQAGLERLAAPGVEALSPEAFEEYAWSALAGAMLEGPLGGGLHLTSAALNPLTASHTLGGRSPDAVDDDRRGTDQILQSAPAFVPANVQEINRTLNNAKNATFQDELQRIRGQVFPDANAAREHLLETGLMVQRVINSVTPPNTRPQTITPEDVANLSDQEALNLAEISMAALTMKNRGYDINEFRNTEIFNTTNETVNRDRKYLYDYRAQRQDKDGNTVDWQPFTKQTIANMPARVSSELSNALRTLSNPDVTQINPDTMNVASAVRGLSRQARANITKDQQNFLTMLNDTQRKQAFAQLQKDNPLLNTTALSSVQDAPDVGLTRNPATLSEQELRDALVESGASLEDIPEGASREVLAQALAQQEQQNINQSPLAKRLEAVPKKTKDRINKAYDTLNKEARKAGIDPRTILQLRPEQRIGFIRNRVPDGTAPKLDNAFKNLRTAVEEIQAEALLEDVRQAFDNMLKETAEFDTVTIAEPRVDYTNLEQTNLNPGLVNSPEQVDILLKRAFPGKVNEKFRSSLKGAIQRFNTNQRQRGMLSGLVYALNQPKLSLEEAKTVFYTLRDLNFWSEAQLKNMRSQAPNLTKRILDRIPDAAVRESLMKDHKRSPLPADVVLAEAFADGIASGKMVAGPTVGEFTRAGNALSNAKNTPFRNLLDTTWNTHEMRDFMVQIPSAEMQNAVMEAHQQAMEINPEALRRDELFQDPKNVALEGTSAYGTNFKMWKWRWTMQNQARKIPALANLVDMVRSKNYAVEQIMNELKLDFMRLVPFGNPTRVAATERALARLDIISQTGQRMDNRTPDGRLMYRDVDTATGELATYVLNEEETAHTDEVLRTLKKVPLIYQQLTMDKIARKNIAWGNTKLGADGTTATNVFEWIESQQKALENMADGPSKDALVRDVEEVELFAHALELQEALLDPALPYFPHLRTTPDTMFQTFFPRDGQGNRMANPHSGGVGDGLLKITVEIAYDPKTRKPSPEHMKEARRLAEEEMNRVYKPHYGAVSLEETTPVQRTKSYRAELGDIGFETAIQDFNALLRSTELSAKEQRAVIEAMRDRRYKRLTATRLSGQAQSYIRMSANIGGYSRSYIPVLGEYLSGAPWVIANDQYADTFRRVDDILAGRNKDIPQDALNEAFPLEQREYLRRQWEYMTEPANDLTWVRQINFFYALGFNLSTAMLNMFTVPTVIYPSMSLFNTGMVNNSVVLSRALKNSYKIIEDARKTAERQGADIKGHTLELQYNRQDLTNTLAKSYGRPKAETMMSIMLPMQNHLQQTVVEENFTRGRVEGIRETRVNETRSKIKNMMDKTQLFAGYPLHMVERFTRLGAFLAYTDLMVNADGTINVDAVRSYMNANKNNQMIQAMLKNRNLSDMSDPRVVQQITTNLIMDTHGIYDKTGRGALQKGWSGAVFFPFMTYPMTVLEFLENTAMTMGPQGKMTFALAMGMFFMFAGMSGVPGAETWKELWESYARLAGNPNDRRFIDADERINKILTVDLGIPPDHARAIQGGVLAYLNMDMHRRIGIPLPWENAMSFLANPDSSYAASKITGVPGRVVLDASQGHLDRLLPVWAQNVIRATQWPSTGAETMEGVSYLSPEQIQWHEAFFRLAGVQPMSITEANLQSRTWRTLEDQYTRPAIQLLMRDLEDIELRRYWNQRAGNDELVRELEEAYNERIWQFRMAFAEDGALPPPELIRSIQTRVSRHVYNRVNPGLQAYGERPGQEQPAFSAPGEDRWGRWSLEERARDR